MAFDKNKEITYTIHDGFDYVLDEGSNTSINLRKVSWNGREPKLEVRKLTYSNGEEKPNKGCTLTDKAADELATVLVENGFGDTKRLKDALSKRVEDKVEEEIEYYDPNELFGE